MFKPYPWQAKPFADQSPILLFTGSTGGGKSFLAAQMIHRFCLQYKNATALILRKMRENVMRSSVSLYETTIVAGDVRVRHRLSRHRFEYSNGSLCLYGGMKDDAQREGIRSIGRDGRVDIVWMEEATSFTENDFNELLARMRGVAAPYTQMILSCNPDAPEHWIRQRLILGKEATVYESKAEDNPSNPASYVLSLNRITGVLGKRLRGGEWVRAEGVIFDTYSDSEDGGNVSDEAAYLPDGGEGYWTIDDGYAGEPDERREGMFTPQSHPRAVLLAQLRSNGRLCIFAESVKIQTLSDAHLRTVMSLPYDEDEILEEAEAFNLALPDVNSFFAFRESREGQRQLPDLYPAPVWVRVGHDAAELRGRIHAAGMYVRGSVAPVEESIKVMRDWLSPDVNNWRRLLIHPDCIHLRNELLSYRRNPATQKPVKEDDHTVDASRILVWDLRTTQ